MGYKAAIDLGSPDNYCHPNDMPKKDFAYDHDLFHYEEDEPMTNRGLL